MNWLWQVIDPANIAAFVTQFQTEMTQPAFWVAVGKIIWINILLSGDNALVIALACRGLSPKHRLWGMILGAGAAVFLRIIFTGIVATLMELPYLKLVGGLALIVIAAKLLVPEQEDEDGVESASHLWAAVRIVVVADIVMSLDNVIAVAAAANGSVPLLVLGLAISVPLIVAGAALIMALLTGCRSWSGPVRRCWAGSPATSSRPIRRFTRSSTRCFRARSASSSMPCWRRLAQVPHFANHGNGGELVCAVLGVIVVLAVGADLAQAHAAKARGAFRRRGVTRSSFAPRRRGG